MCGKPNDSAKNTIVKNKIYSCKGGEGHQEEGEQHRGQMGDLHPAKKRRSQFGNNDVEQKGELK